MHGTVHMKVFTGPYSLPDSVSFTLSRSSLRLVIFPVVQALWFWQAAPQILVVPDVGRATITTPQ